MRGSEPGGSGAMAIMASRVPGRGAGLLGRFEVPPGRNGTAATQIFYREDISLGGTRSTASLNHTGGN
ncbi:MAG: hypothetical protein BWX84_01626 [Verrucomicrobia bacterium ADurb.Bin118]|jgi:hypothetical protein|nr:MAG: hypothetical protein BWX84_01626 [Verrucomicrobia bacterium ADurb.Bin118]